LHEKWEYPNGVSSKHFIAFTRGAPIRLHRVALFGYNFANGYDINTWRISAFHVASFGEMNNVLRVRLHSTTTAVISGEGNRPWRSIGL
jgi:hypothetical protein